MQEAHGLPEKALHRPPLVTFGPISAEHGVKRLGAVDIRRPERSEDLAHALGEGMKHLGQVPLLRLAMNGRVVGWELGVGLRLVACCRPGSAGPREAPPSWPTRWPSVDALRARACLRNSPGRAPRCCEAPGCTGARQRARSCSSGQRPFGLLHPGSDGRDVDA